MNCKPGDLAVIVRSKIASNIGHFVVVLDDRNCDEGEWRCSSASPLVGEDLIDGGFRATRPGESVWGMDSDLRPIRDPGDDARDETLAWKPVPLPEILPSLLPTKEHA